MIKNSFKRNQLSTEYQNLINQVNLLEDSLKILDTSELRVRLSQLKKRYSEGQSLYSLIAESFALTREASLRTLGLRHFDVQLIGGLVLNNQKIAEMKTGEGKTLVATLPACLNALNGGGVHIVTVNDYLANRDQVAMSPIYRSLGFETGLIQDHLSRIERHQNYDADITYVTNYQLAFDFLKDNMALNHKDVVLQPFNYCVIDEVDSILIDEAQTPLILSNNIETLVHKVLNASEITEYLQPRTHYEIYEKNRTVILTDKGNKQVEYILGIQDLYDSRNPWIPYIINALKARALFIKNTDYIIQDNKIVIVDEFTGRIMPDRRWGEGLHQAIEAKEGLSISEQTETVASITYQNFFLLYPKLSGMTGTGKTAEIEFEKIYNLSVDEIPTARPSKRKDLPDFIYKDQFSKWTAIAQTCNKISSTKQPILIGTTTIEKSEMLAQLLREYNLTYQLLNARPENIRKESEIVAQAGKKKAITIATNMAGRGTDIILGGNINFEIQKELYNSLTRIKNATLAGNSNSWLLASHLKYNSQRFLSVVFSLLKDINFLSLTDIDVLRVLRENDKLSVALISYQCSVRFLFVELKKYYQKHQNQENQIVKNLGGLYIIGTERNNSRRVDNQLRGRCGRQGDPGTSRFFLSLEDNLIRLFGGSSIRGFMKSQMLDDSPLESKWLTKALDSAQDEVEERAYQQRKNLFDYDDLLNQQRNIIYYERRQILNAISAENAILSMGEQVIIDIIDTLTSLKLTKNFQDETVLVLEILLGKRLILQYLENSNSIMNSFSYYELKLHLFDEFWLTYQAKRSVLTIYKTEFIEIFERTIILTNIDKIWREHLQKISFLREAVSWRGYGQRNPLYEYRQDAFSMFDQSIKTLRHLIIYDLLRSKIQ